MRKKPARVIATGLAGFVLAVMAAVAVPGVANAEDSLINTPLIDLRLDGTATDAERADAKAETLPTVTGDCDATLAGADGAPITVDAGAPLGQAGDLDLGLSSASQGTGGAGDTPALTIPVSDALESVGADDVPVVSDTAAQGCDVVRVALNSTGRATQAALLTGGSAGEHPGTDPEEPSEDPAEPPAGESPGDSPQSSDGFTQEPSVPGFSTIGNALPVTPALPDLQLGGIPSMRELPSAPKLGHDARAARDAQRNSGLAVSLPASKSSSNRLPYTLAVVALAVVAAAFIRRWVIRSH